MWRVGTCRCGLNTEKENIKKIERIQRSATKNGAEFGKFHIWRKIGNTKSTILGREKERESWVWYTGSWKTEKNWLEWFVYLNTGETRDQYKKLWKIKCLKACPHEQAWSACNRKTMKMPESPLSKITWQCPVAWASSYNIAKHLPDKLALGIHRRLSFHFSLRCMFT